MIDGGDFAPVLDGGTFTGAVATDTYRGGSFKDWWFEVDTLETPVVTGVQSGFNATNDQYFYNYVGGVLKQNKILDIRVTENLKPEKITFEALNPGVATINDWGQVKQINNGAASFNIYSDSVSWNKSFDFQTVTTGVTTFSGYFPNSLALHIITGVDNRISGRGLEALNMYSVRDDAGSNYTRNTNCWANIDLTCLAVSQGPSGGMAPQGAGTLITPKHFIGAAHFQIGVGANIRFITNNNVIVNRIVTGTVTHPAYIPYYPDIYIGVLDSPVPTGATGINFAYVLPTGIAAYLPSISYAYPIPSLGADQERKATIQNLYDITGYYGYTAKPTGQRNVFYEDKIIYDSSSPMFIIINGKLVLFQTLTFGGPGGGTNLINHYNIINSLISGFGTGYSLSSINLNNFPIY